MADQRKIYITASDMERLQKLIEAMRSSREDLNGLSAELKLATIVAPDSVPDDVITMNSKFRLRDVEMEEDMTYTLVFPEQANIEEGRISVLAPIGTAALGHRVGDEIEWEVPAGRVRLRIEEILYQPEAAGHYHL